MLFIRGLVHVTLVFGVMGVMVPFLISRLDRFLPRFTFGWAYWTGAIIFVSGILMGLCCTLLLAAKGLGTPSPYNPPKRLVMDGPYKYMRNPMAVSFVVTLLGEGIFFASLAILAYSVLIFLIYHMLIIPWEERNLERRFGSLYMEYKARVPRWLPRVL